MRIDQSCCETPYLTELFLLHRQPSIGRESADRRLHGSHTGSERRSRPVEAVRAGGAQGPRAAAAGPRVTPERRPGGRAQGSGGGAPRRHRPRKALRSLSPRREPNECLISS